MIRSCNNCVNWIPLIDNGQCKLDSHYCEHDNKCDKHKFNYMNELLVKYGRSK